MIQKEPDIIGATNPLILTLSINDNAFLFFNSLRKKHFPASRNFIDAHVTLFHSLPNAQSTIDVVEAICKKQTIFTMLASDVVSLGNGVAVKIESSELVKLHHCLQSEWWNLLKPQDQQKIWPHITIQNKVSAQEAKQLLDELRSEFKPFSVSANGLKVWEYLGGPWKLINKFSFQVV